MIGVYNGVLSYHLRSLDNTGKIRVNRVKKKVTRYFSYDVFPHKSSVVCLLRQESTRKIIIYMLEKGPCGFSDIKLHTRKVFSTLSGHMA
jgi:predicted transcriptional regulator